mgnify:CR=1 FL=1
MSRKTEQTTIIDALISRNLYQERLAQGLSRQEVASKLGITQQQLHKYEKGHNRISATRLWLIAKILNRPLEFFFDGETVEYKNIRSRMCIEVSRHFLQIKNPKQQNVIHALIKTLSEE